MGVAQYRLSPALPDKLKHDLPTAADLEQNFLALSALACEIDVEGALRDFAAAHDIAANAPVSIDLLLQELSQRGIAPPATERLLEALCIMNDTVQGINADSDAVVQAIGIGRQFLAELSRAEADVEL